MDNINERIKNWLRNPEVYSDGVLLFEEAGGNKALLRYFQNGSATFRIDKLIYELSKIVETPQPPKQQVKVAVVKQEIKIPDCIAAVKKKLRFYIIRLIKCTRSYTN